MSEVIQSTALPAVEQIDNRGDETMPFGFVYFTESNYSGQRVRIGYVGGVRNAQDSEEARDAVQGAPYLFQANWGEANAGHFLAGWRALAALGVSGFYEADDTNNTVVRIDNDGTVGQLWANELHQLAVKEFKQYQKTLKLASDIRKRASR